RGLLAGAETLRARAESIAANVEPELTLAVDAMFPNAILIASLKALKSAYPHLPVTLYTEGLGAAEQRLRDGVARLMLLTILLIRPAALVAGWLAICAEDYHETTTALPCGREKAPTVLLPSDQSRCRRSGSIKDGFSKDGACGCIMKSHKDRPAGNRAI